MGTINFTQNSFDYPQYTWANRPSKALTGSIIIITDIGASDEFFTWTGTRWAPLNGCIVVGQTNTSVSVTGTAAVTQMASITVPGGLMGPNGILEVFHMWTYTNSANNKAIIVRMNGPSGTAFFSRGEQTTTFHQALTIIRNNNSVSAQKGPVISLSGGFGTSTGTESTGAINTGNNFDIYASAQLTNTGETITLQNIRVVYRE